MNRHFSFRHENTISVKILIGKRVPQGSTRCSLLYSANTTTSHFCKQASNSRFLLATPLYTCAVAILDKSLLASRRPSTSQGDGSKPGESSLRPRRPKHTLPTPDSVKQFLQKSFRCTLRCVEIYDSGLRFPIDHCSIKVTEDSRREKTDEPLLEGKRQEREDYLKTDSAVESRVTE
ncbi:hypothetical protein EVAR_47006_1, partial [Eumeta japonica]